MTLTLNDDVVHAARLTEAQMLQELSDMFPERAFRVHADGFYASLAGRLPPRVHLISRIRRDAVLYDLPPQRRPHQRGRSRKRGQRLACPERMARQVRSWKRIRTSVSFRHA